MIKKFHTLLALLLTATTLASCVSSDDNDEDLSGECYISTFTLGTLRRIVHTTGSDGQDSSYYVTFSGTYYPLTINQRTGTIVNTEPLPYGTVLSNALANITAQGSVIYAREANLTDTTSWKAYASSDSIDFSEPLLFRAYAYDGSGYRQYRVTLNVRENEKGSYTWEHVGDLAFADTRTAAKLVLQGEQPMTFCLDAYGHLFATPFGQEEQACSGVSAPVDVQTICRFGGKLWASSNDGPLFCSDDGIAWNIVEQSGEEVGVKLIAGSENALYAVIFDPRIPAGSTAPYAAMSTDGQTWTPMETDAQMFTSPKAALAYKQSNGNQRVLVAAETDNSAWSHLYTWSLLEKLENKWMLFTEESNPYPLPALSHLSLVSNNGLLMAFGAQQAENGKDALDTIYTSYDNGITWKASTTFVVPSEVKGAQEAIAAVADESAIWLLAAGQLWRAQLNP